MEKSKSNDLKKVETSGVVALPFDENQFKDFIVSLLGKPQTLAKRFEGNFEIDKDDIITLFELLNQRITQQNDSRLIQFTATVYYDDNSTVTLNGFEHLVHYNETVPIISKGLHLTWQYLIKFRDKTTFEKQEINVSFITESENPIRIDGEESFFHRENYASIRIHHTARTWGADIEGLLSRHLQTVIKKSSRFINFFRYNDETITSAITGLLTLITLSFILWDVVKLRQDNKYNRNILFWIHHYFNYIFLIGGVFILIKITLIILEELRFLNKPSFILLTKESIHYKEKTLRSYKNNWYKYVWTIVSSVVIGVIANYLFFLLSK